MRCHLVSIALCTLEVAHAERLALNTAKLIVDNNNIAFGTNHTQTVLGVRAAPPNSGCTCGADDNLWNQYCICDVDPNCEWNGPLEHCEALPEEGLEEDTVQYEPAELGAVADREVGEDRFVLLGRFPIVSQNTLDRDEGSHACWAVTRACNYRFAGALGPDGNARGAKYYSNWLYTKSPTSGWFVPNDLASFKLNGQFARVWNDNDKLNQGRFAMWVKHHVNKDRSIAVAMGKKDCKSTFHYVTIIGATSDNSHVIVMDPWCPRYKNDWPIYYTKKNKNDLGRYDAVSGDDDYDATNHPCLVKAKISDFKVRALTKAEKNKGHDKVGMPFLDGLNYASGGGGRCAFKMWLVCRKAEYGKCQDDAFSQ